MRKLGCFSTGIMFVLFNLVVGCATFDYSLWFVFGKNIPWYMDMLFGVVLAELTIPVAIVCLILEWCGVPSPIIH